MHGMSAGTLIWIGIVLFAVIARMVKTGEQGRRRNGAPLPPQPPVPRPRPLPPQPLPPQRPVRRVTPAATPPAGMPLPAATALAEPWPQEPAVPTLDLRPLVDASAAPSSVGRMTAAFAGRSSMIRAIVAAEVIGPPKAFVELDNWSHRHREV